MKIATDDQRDRHLEKWRRDRLFRASKQTLPSDDPAEAEVEDLPAFLSRPAHQNEARRDFRAHLSKGFRSNWARVNRLLGNISTAARDSFLSARGKLAAAEAALKATLLRLYERLRVSIEGMVHWRLSIPPIPSVASALRSRRQGLYALARKGIADWPRGLIFALHAQLAAGVLALAILAALIVRSPKSLPFAPRGSHPSNIAFAPIFDLEKRLDLSAGLRNWLKSGGAIADKFDTSVKGERPSPSGLDEQASTTISGPGLVIFSGLPSGARVSNGTQVNEAQWGVPTGGDEPTVIVLPSSADQSFRTGLEFFNGAGSPSGRINLEVTHDAPKSPTGDLLAQRQSLQSAGQGTAVTHRPAKHLAKKSPTISRKLSTPTLISGSTASQFVNAPGPAAPPSGLSFLGFLTPQTAKPSVPLDTPTTIGKSWAPESLTDIFKNAY